MSKRIVSDPSQHGWVEVDGKWVWGASGGSGAGAGMVISETEPTDKVEGMQWLNPTTGLVLFWDDEKWLQMPGGVNGKDGVDGLWTDEGSNTISYSGTVLMSHPDAGASAVAVGDRAGSASQGDYATSVGIRSGQTNQGESGVAIGNGAGSDNQGVNAVAVGRAAGETTQGETAVAVGRLAGQSGQLAGATAIGNSSGNLNQGVNAIAIGYQSGKDNQGENSIAVGNQSGRTDQGANGIIINSTGNAVNSTTAGHIIIKSPTTDLRSLPAGGFAMNGDPIVGTRGLIKTLSTLRQATMDETQDIRESLRSAIDQLVAGFEKDIETAKQLAAEDVDDE